MESQNSNLNLDGKDHLILTQVRKNCGGSVADLVRSLPKISRETIYYRVRSLTYNGLIKTVRERNALRFYPGDMVVV